MSSAINNIIIYNGYPLSVVVAVGLHITLLVSLLYLQGDSKVETIDFIQPTVIKSLFIDENPQVTNQKNIERRRLERIEQQRVERQQDDARKRTEADAAAQQRRQKQEAVKAAADAQELSRQQAVLRDREEVDRLLLEQQRREREREQRETEQADSQRQEEARERSEQRAREAEQASAAAENAARTEFELIQSATGLIQQVIQENWSRPPSARNGMRTILQISMLHTGEVTDVTITQSSNDPAFDRAAETAVFRAAPFAELQSLPIRTFNDNFRSFSLTFQPEDLLN